MPVTSSAKKALRQEKRRTKVNALVKQRMKSAVKIARETGTPVAISQAYSALDKAAKKKIIHANKAARLKSRLIKAVKRQAGPKPKADKASTPKKRKTSKKK